MIVFFSFKLLCILQVLTDTCKTNLDTTQENKPHKDSGSAGKHVCLKCNKTFHRKHHLTRHMNFHLGRFKFYCDQCKKGSEIVQTTSNIRINMRVLCTGALCVQRHFLRKGVEIYTCPCILVFIGSPAVCVVKDLMKRTVMTNTVSSIDD